MVNGLEREVSLECEFLTRFITSLSAFSLSQEKTRTITNNV